MPAPLDRLVDGLRGCEVVPQPRYPELPSSGAYRSLYALDTEAVAAPGPEGSLFGLNPYSSTSLRRSSSANLLALRLLHHHIRTQIIKPTETTGTTTATAIVLCADSPEPEEAAALVARDVPDAEDVVEDALVVEEACVGGAVDVITTVFGGIDVVEVEDDEVELDDDDEDDDDDDDVEVGGIEVVVVVGNDVVVDEIDELLVVLVMLELVVVGGSDEVDEMEEEVVDVGFGDTAANIK